MEHETLNGWIQLTVDVDTRYDGGSVEEVDPPFEVEAEEYLEAAKRHLVQTNDEVGLADALGDAKKALDCRLRQVLFVFALDGQARRERWSVPKKLDVLAELALNPTRTRVWAPIGVPYELETPGNNRMQVIFGVVNSLTVQTHFALTAHKRSADFQRFVDHDIIPAYPEADLFFLTVDGASIYDSKSTSAWLAEHPRIVLVPLPSYAPKLNLQEHLWHWLRHDVTHSHFLGSLATLVAAAKRFFAKLAEQPEKVLQRIGMAVRPLDRYLAKVT